MIRSNASTNPLRSPTKSMCPSSWRRPVRLSAICRTRSFDSRISSPRFKMNRRNFHDLSKSARIPDDSADDIDPISRNRIGPQTHGGSPKKDRQNLSCSPESNVSDLHLSRRGFPIVADSGNRKVELFSPHADRSRDRKGRVDFISRLRLSEFGFQLNSPHSNTNSLRRRSHTIDGLLIASLRSS